MIHGIREDRDNQDEENEDGKNMDGENEDGRTRMGRTSMGRTSMGKNEYACTLDCLYQWHDVEKRISVWLGSATQGGALGYYSQPRYDSSTRSGQASVCYSMSINTSFTSDSPPSNPNCISERFISLYVCFNIRTLAASIFSVPNQ